MSVFPYKKLTKEECEEQMKSKKIYFLVPKGIYDFEVVESRFKISNSGNPMISLILKITDNQGVERLIFDNLIAIDMWEWKTRHFCDSVGLEKEYDEDKFNDNVCLFQRGKLSLGIQKGNKKDDGTFYPDKNVVDDYLPRTANQGSVAKAMASVVGDLDDAIPF